jgi:hypothetical protein
VTTKLSKAELELVLLEVGQSLRDELRDGVLGVIGPPTLIARITILKDRCYEAIGDPSMADVYHIKERAERAKYERTNKERRKAKGKA